MNEEQFEQEQVEEKADGLGLPTFNSFSSKVSYPAFSADEENSFGGKLVDAFLENKEIAEFKKVYSNKEKYHQDYLAEVEGVATAHIKFHMSKLNDEMIAEVDKKLEGIKREQVTSHSTQQTTELSKQTAIQYFSALTQVGSKQDLIAFAYANKDSVELLSLVHMKLAGSQVTVTDTQALAEVKQLLDEALGLPEKAQLEEYKELLERNKHLIRNEGMMYFPKSRDSYTVNKVLGLPDGLERGL